MEPRTVLLTGASSGLGLAIARRLLATSHRLILTARPASLARLAAAGVVAGERVRLWPLDVTDAAARAATVARADRELGGVDVLVNNAGAMYRAVSEHLSEAEQLEQVRVNYLAPMDLARLVLPHMRARRRGHVINISSVGGMMAMPTMAAYSASKFALEGASEALYYEVRPWDVHVTLIEPGFIRSGSYRNVRFTRASQSSRDDLREAYHAHYEHMEPFIERLMRWARATPERVAERVVRTMERRSPPLRVPASLDAHLFSGLRRWLPRRLYHAVLYRALPRVSSWGR